MQGKNIVLSGMPGSGKTTVGKILSSFLNVDFIDLDEYIENNSKMKISDIFAQYGEKYFRELEYENLKKLSGDFVLSLGGGTVMRDENIEIINKIGVLFYIKTDLRTIFDRIKEDKTRPLLNCDNPYKKLEELYQKRKDRFEGARYTIDGNKTPHEIKEEIIKIYENINR